MQAEQRGRIAPLLPEKARNPGRPAADNLSFVEAVLLLRDALATLAKPVMLRRLVADP
jgi:hypothetical protein